MCDLVLEPIGFKLSNKPVCNITVNNEYIKIFTPKVAHLYKDVVPTGKG